MMLKGLKKDLKKKSFSAHFLGYFSWSLSDINGQRKGTKVNTIHNCVHCG